MTDEATDVRYVPLDPAAARTESPARLPFDPSTLSVAALVIICELAVPPAGNSRPVMSMKITQYLRLSDESLIRLDMDRGMDTFRFGYEEPLSWKRTAAEVRSDVLTLVRGDEPNPGEFPWHEYAQAARLRGIAIDAEALSDVPHTVLFSDELATTFEF